MLAIPAGKEYTVKIRALSVHARERARLRFENGWKCADSLSRPAAGWAVCGDCMGVPVEENCVGRENS